jgi:hypothetical protein
LTGRDIVDHAQEEARKWLRSRYSVYTTRINYKEPEQSHHRQFLDYVEAFVSEFPPRTPGYPKD